MKRAIGNMAQLMPDTARLLNVNPRIPSQNLDFETLGVGNTRVILSQSQYKRFRPWRLAPALAAYDHEIRDSEAVVKYGGVCCAVIKKRTNVPVKTSRV